MYDGIYLVRNERHFKIYNFDDGQAFDSDFVLFLREKSSRHTPYAVILVKITARHRWSPVRTNRRGGVSRPSTIRAAATSPIAN